MLPGEPLRGQAFTACTKGLEYRNPTPRGSNELHAHLHESHQNTGTAGLHGQLHALSTRGGDGNSIESQMDHGVLQR